MTVNRKIDKANTVEKDRIRREIEAQIAAFLGAGGKIDVLHGNHGKTPATRGSVWRSSDDIPGVSQ